MLSSIIDTCWKVGFFSIYTYHKRLVYDFNAKPDCHSPKEVQRLDFISQYTTDIPHIKRANNPQVDAWSRMELNTIQQIATY